MTNNRLAGLSSMTTKQKVMALVFVAIIVFVIYQVIGLFGGGGASAPKVAANSTEKSAMPQPPIQKPQPANLLPTQTAASIQEQEMMRQQQAAQAQYLASLNQLQNLKVAKDIAETNRAIITAKLATITAQKSIVDLLSKPTNASPQSYAQGLVNPAPGSSPNGPAQPIQSDINYTVISVSQLQGRWGAVLGSQGNLYSVSMGDVLQDKSVVISIDKSGVRQKVSLVPII
jgi:hypothetical protein